MGAGVSTGPATGAGTEVVTWAGAGTVEGQQVWVGQGWTGAGVCITAGGGLIAGTWIGGLCITVGAGTIAGAGAMGGAWTTIGAGAGGRTCTGAGTGATGYCCTVGVAQHGVVSGCPVQHGAWTGAGGALWVSWVEGVPGQAGKPEPEAWTGHRTLGCGTEPADTQPPQRGSGVT